MKFLIILSLLAFNTQAKPFRVKSFDGEKGIAVLDIPVPDGWKISRSDGEYGDYLVTENKSVYLLGAYMMGQVNDKNIPLSLEEFEEARNVTKARKVTLNGIDIYVNINKNDTEIESYLFLRFVKTGIVFQGAMYPYPELRTNNLNSQEADIIKVLSKALFPHK